jgi:hypothetical protein
VLMHRGCWLTALYKAYLGLLRDISTAMFETLSSEYVLLLSPTSQVYESTLMDFLEGLQEDSSMQNSWYLLGTLSIQIL